MFILCVEAMGSAAFVESLHSMMWEHGHLGATRALERSRRDSVHEHVAYAVDEQASHVTSIVTHPAQTSPSTASLSTPAFLVKPTK